MNRFAGDLDEVIVTRPEHQVDLTQSAETHQTATQAEIA